MNTQTIRDDELGAALRALETPEHRPGFDAELRRRLAEKPSAARVPLALRHVGLRRPRTVAVAAAVAVAVTIPAVVLVQGLASESSSRDWSAAVGDLPALAPGKPKPQGASSSSMVVRLSREDLLRDATSVFVGTVVAKGGSELVDPPSQDFVGTTVHRVRFDVERTLRGEGTEALDLTIPDGVPDAHPFQVGDHVLVFASSVEFGELLRPGLTPLGFFQGVFRVKDDGTARNEWSDISFSLDELEAELR